MVADEVRKLTERTATSCIKISRIVGSCALRQSQPMDEGVSRVEAVSSNRRGDSGPAEWSAKRCPGNRGGSTACRQPEIANRSNSRQRDPVSIVGRPLRGAAGDMIEGPTPTPDRTAFS